MASLSAEEAPDLITVTSDEAADRAHLADLIAQATSRYAVKDYSPASELYSRATELQAELNGEMAIENADLLYSYGKCLYFVAVSNSDVLGAKAAGEKVGNLKDEKKTKGKRKATNADTAPSKEDRQVAEEVVAKIATEKQPGVEDTTADGKDKTDVKPLFQFTGDENWDDSDEEEEVDENEAEDGEEEDDLSNAFEILDIARVLLVKKLEHLRDTAAESTTKGKGKSKSTESGDTDEIRQVKERLADTHDLQAEISLEGERFPNAVTDLSASLALKEEMYPQESSVIAECHYKLSLAIEFSSVTQQTNENGEAIEGKEAVVDEAMRKEAATEMEKAIESCKLRIKKEQALLDSGTTEAHSEDSKSKPITQKEIDEVKELVADMQQRLIDLRAPPVSINDPTSTGTLTGSTPLNGILGQILGESADQQKQRLEEASSNANDLSGLVKRKKPKDKEDGKQGTTGLVRKIPVEPVSNGVSDVEIPIVPTSNGKRKAREDESGEAGVNGKKARVEDAVD